MTWTKKSGMKELLRRRIGQAASKEIVKSFVKRRDTPRHFLPGQPRLGILLRPDHLACAENDNCEKDHPNEHDRPGYGRERRELFPKMENKH
jgi:hypothetical protein